MVRQHLWFSVALAGCSFQARNAPSVGGNVDAFGGEPMVIDAAIDAPPDGVPDAKVYRDAPAVEGALAVTVANVPNGDTNLTTEGTTDWAHWGYASVTGFDHKNGANKISDETVVGGGSRGGISNITSTFSWTDGTPHMAASAVNSATGFNAPSGLQFTVPADTTSHTLRVYVGNKSSTARLDVALSDASATAYSNTQTAGGTSLHLEYTITFNAASAGQTLTVTWTDTADSGGFAFLMAATLQ